MLNCLAHSRQQLRLNSSAQQWSQMAAASRLALGVACNCTLGIVVAVCEQCRHQNSVLAVPEPGRARVRQLSSGGFGTVPAAV